MRFALLLAAALLLPAAAPALAGPQLFCDPRDPACDHAVPTVNIAGTVQAGDDNDSTVIQDADVNMQGTIQAGRTNKSAVGQNGKLNISDTRQVERP